MQEQLTDKRAIVGVPFFDGEGRDVLDACLENIDTCLNYLNIDAAVVVGINGPRVASGRIPLSYQIDRSKYNADIRFIKTPMGLVEAEKEIGRRAIREGYRRIFLTDADISRLPRSLHRMWYKGDAQIVGARYASYPVDILIGSGIEFTPEELAFMNIFQADKHPLAREFTSRYRPPKRLKGSLLLVDTRIIERMFGSQSITSDSRMNRVVADEEKQVVPDAGFMHFARISITDHVIARLRHFRAAAAEGDLGWFSQQSLMYGPETANLIYRSILRKHPDATEVASNFLLQCGLRYWVTELCHAVASGEIYELPAKSTEEMNITVPVGSFEEARERTRTLLAQVDLQELFSPESKGVGTTNNDKTRVPIDLTPFLRSEGHRECIYRHLGIEEEAAP